MLAFYSSYIDILILSISRTSHIFTCSHKHCLAC